MSNTMSDTVRDSIDACLGQAFRNVRVPEGLAERLLAGLATRQPRRSHRWLWAASGILTAAATLLIALWLNTPAEPRFSETLALDEAIRLFDEGLGQPANPEAKRATHPDFPFSQHVYRFPQASWRALDDFLGGHGVVYDLPGPAGTRAALYVVARDGIADFDTVPAITRALETGGCCAVAWQEGGLLYVLVAQGNESTIRGYLIRPSSPLA
jgi:hypothetical protein